MMPKCGRVVWVRHVAYGRQKMLVGKLYRKEGHGIENVKVREDTQTGR
jgi:hypothetical protein